MEESRRPGPRGLAPQNADRRPATHEKVVNSRSSCDKRSFKGRTYGNARIECEPRNGLKASVGVYAMWRSDFVAGQKNAKFKRGGYTLFDPAWHRAKGYKRDTRGDRCDHPR
jgi:hypothetical protein